MGECRHFFMGKIMITAKQIWDDVQSIRAKAPLVHNITNYVVMNTTANALLSLGASPVMAHAIEEVEEMVGIAGALVINIGTLSEKWISAMTRAVVAAENKGIPIIIDPVGAGATKLRTNTVHDLMKNARPTIIRGNGSEIIALAGAESSTKGVDSIHGAEAAIEAANILVEKYQCVVSISGSVDVILDSDNKISIANGHFMMPKVTGLGCTASALTGAFAAVNSSPIMAAANAMAVMGITGEIAADKSDGPGSLQLNFLDTLYLLDEKMIEKRLKTDQ
jgi:hydroxyethylthiazole kinase